MKVNSQSTHLRYLSIAKVFISIPLLASVVLFNSAKASEEKKHPDLTPPYATEASQAALTAADAKMVYQQAVLDDLAGRPAQARKGYDAIAQFSLPDMAVPSAVNYVALGDLAQARTAFTTLAGSTDSREADYAQLWNIWLMARTSRTNKEALQQQLLKQVMQYQWHSHYEQAVADLYSGSGSLNAIYAAVEEIPLDQVIKKQDALTETTFFAAGYLQYVNKDNQAALKLIDSNQAKLSSLSLERPLIDRERASLEKLINNVKHLN